MVILHLVQKLEQNGCMKQVGIIVVMWSLISAETSNEYARGDHQHPLQVSTVLPAKDTANGEAGIAATYTRSDHSHHVNLSNDVPLKDTGSGTAGTANIYASATHQHPLNVDPSTANLPLVNATAAANGTSDFCCRNDHVHPQQLTYDGNIAATKFIKTGGLTTEMLMANGDTINGVVDIATDQTIIAYALYFGTGTTRTCELWIQLHAWCNTVLIEYTNSGTVTAPIANILTTPTVEELPTDYTSMITLTPNLQFDQQTINNVPFTQNGRSTGNNGANPLGFVILKAGEELQADRGLQICADGNTLTFNGRTI
ncbi:MAG: hypothetical protein EZS28_009118 [Streblomastix strix]|uniref:Uncharacterized protein n=1 Tax=Streblomastix strix TaxID=222440 RepID=A0A5J4WL52_9EUKA|nr:MAG: hypothetical protein EZS28_009118 [Streblomastix strix]